MPIRTESPWTVQRDDSHQYRWFIQREGSEVWGDGRTVEWTEEHRDRRGRIVRYGRRATAEQIADLKNGVHLPNSYYNQNYGD